MINVWDTVSAYICLPRMSLPMDSLLFKKGLDKLLLSSFISDVHSKLSIINRGIPGLVTESPCSLGDRGSTTCLVYNDPLLGLCLKQQFQCKSDIVVSNFILISCIYSYSYTLSKFCLLFFLPMDFTLKWLYFTNPLRAKFFRGSINIYLHFMSFLHINLTQVLETLPQVSEGPTYSI